MFLAFAIVVAFLASVAPAVADQAEDEKAIREASEKVMAAFNAHDAKAQTPLFDEKIEAWNGTGKGRAEHEKGYVEYFQNRPKIGMKHLDEIGIVFITPDVAIHKLRREMTGRVDADGKPLPDVKHLHARVFVKRNGKWLLAAYFSTPTEE
jgi:uncharacterized protein (TIGR02246 family)